MTKTFFKYLIDYERNRRTLMTFRSKRTERAIISDELAVMIYLLPMFRRIKQM